MKKLKRLLIVFILFIIHANINYCEVAEKYAVSKTKSNGKMLFLLIGLVLISMVLFLGYKMDKMEENIDRKKKYTKNKEVRKSYDNDIIENDEIANYENNTEDEEKSVEIIDEFNNNIESIDENVEETTERKIESEKLNLVSNVFNKKEDDIKNISVKGYDYDFENDTDLLDIENTIKAANIKRYTRKKDNKDEVKSDNVVKHYTRKIDNGKKENKPKRYTRKIQVAEDTNNLDITLEDIIEVNNVDEIDENNFLSKIVDLGDDEKETTDIDIKTKSRRGRKPKTESKKIEELPKSKRGRKPKTEKKDTPKEEKTKSKRGRKPKVKTEEEELRQVIEMLPKSRRGRKPKAK